MVERSIYNSLDFTYFNPLLFEQTGVPLSTATARPTLPFTCALNHPQSSPLAESGTLLLHHRGSNGGIMEEPILFKLYPASPLGRKS